MFDSPDAQFALTATRRAALLVRLIQQELISPAMEKQDRSPVTVADYASQAVVAELLRKVLPGDVLVAEEDAATLRTAAEQENLNKVTDFVQRVIPGTTAADVCDLIDLGGGEPGERFWVLDPIDGTKGFLRGEQYAVALALIEDGQVQLGVLGCPNLTRGHQQEQGGPGSLLIAVREEGAWLASLEGDDFTPLSISELDETAGARILRSVESGHTNADQVGQLAEVLGTTAPPVRMDSQAKYGVLAAGEAELLVRLLSPSRPDYRERIWDQAAGAIIVTEAGGRVTDLDGLPLDFTHGRGLERNRGVVATNGYLHDAVLEALARIGA